MQQPAGDIDVTVDDTPVASKKIKDLEVQRDAVVEAAGISAGLWVSYLFVLFYLAIAAGSVTHRDLFFETPVKLPFFNVELPIVAFFALAPLLLLIVHTYVLLHFVQFADKIGEFNTKLKKIPTDEVQSFRQQLPSNIFAQLLAGPHEIRSGIKGFLLWLTANISLVVAPLATLLLFQLTFLPYHDVTTWWHRILIGGDLLVLWLLWPSIARGQVRRGHNTIWNVWSDLGGVKVAVLAVLSVFLFVQCLTIATYPGEWLHRLPSLRFIPWRSDGSGFPFRLVSPYQLLFAEGVDLAKRKPTGLLSNRLVLPGLNVIDPVKYDSEAKIAAVSETISLRARHLEGAVLIDAKLPNADFTAAILTGAQFDRADLRGARFECVGQFCAQIAGASFVEASLQGASLVGAQLQNAQFAKAKMQGAQLDKAQMQGADLSAALLQSASLNQTQMQAADLGGARLQGASLFQTQLQGADLNFALLDHATLFGVFVWRADIRESAIGVTDARIAGPITAAKEPCKDRINSCDWTTDSFARLRKLVPDDTKIGHLDKDRTPRLDGEDDMASTWLALASRTLPPDAFEKGLLTQLRETGCVAEGAPYVVHGTILSVGSLGLSPDQRSSLASFFLDPGCTGARGLNEADRAKLTDMKRQQPAAAQ